MSIKTKRRLAKREPQMNEGDKKALFLKGGRTNELVSTFLKDFVSFYMVTSFFFFLNWIILCSYLNDTLLV